MASAPHQRPSKATGDQLQGMVIVASDIIVAASAMQEQRHNSYSKLLPVQCWSATDPNPMLQQRFTTSSPNHGGYESTGLAGPVKQMHTYASILHHDNGQFLCVIDRRTKGSRSPRAITTTTVLSANFVPESCDGKVGQHGHRLTGADARKISSAQLSAV